MKIVGTLLPLHCPGLRLPAMHDWIPSQARSRASRVGAVPRILAYFIMLTRRRAALVAQLSSANSQASSLQQGAPLRPGTTYAECQTETRSLPQGWDMN
ncbi:hypothetical protein AAFF_G00155010 [Aldrovandia affinis]|uniref:Uncharacterized protein n=1 Tax=Aldrovandia affinis TaxID=143900 RepID=A0AAD7T016_9TELE|nr:hypothetical protein AAFF_G00155010 [Aldrovandia affinis]